MKRWICSTAQALALLCCVWCMGAERVYAQTDSDYIPDKLNAKKTAKKDGWFPSLKAGLNFSFAQSDGVVGIANGTTLSLGLQVQGKLIYAYKGHEWRSALNVVHTQTKLPNLKPFLKAADRFELETMYLYRFQTLKWLGVFAGLRLNTPLLDGFLVREESVRVRVLDRTGTELRQADLTAQVPFRLTPPFSPLQFKQSLGVSFEPYSKSFLNVDIKFGGGALQTFTQDGLRLADDEATPELELSQLFDYIQAGVELQLELSGTLFKKILNYKFTGEVMLPLYTSVDTGQSPFDLLNFQLTFQIQIKVLKWLSVNYNLNVIRAPLIQPDIQVVNNLVLSLTINIL